MSTKNHISALVRCILFAALIMGLLGLQPAQAVLAAGLPDLIIQSIIATPANPAIDQDVTLSVIIKNQGQTNITSAFWVDLFIDEPLPTDCSGQGTDYKGVSGLAAGASQTVTFSYSFTSAGIHTINGIVDTNCEVSESDETNNINIIPIDNSGGSGIYDDSNPAWSYSGNWSTYTGSGPYASTLHYTTQKDATASFVFQAPAKFVLSYTTYSNRGNIEVWVDGSLLTTLNANSASLTWQKTYTSADYSDSLNHTVVLKNTNSGGQVIDVDAIQIVAPPAPRGAGTYDDANSNWSYTGTWSALTTSGPYASTLHYTSQQNATASFVFRAPAKFVLSYTTYSNRGNIEVWVDGNLLTTLNANSPSLTWQKTYTSPNYPDNSSHTVVLKNANSAGQVIDVDAIQIVPPPLPQGAGTYDDANANWGYTGSWSTLTTSGPYASTLHYTTQKDATASFVFQAPAKFVLSYTTYSNRGNIEVWVDGSLLTTLNANSASLIWQKTYTSPDYTDSGSHTIVLKNANTAGQVIDVDAIQIVAPPVPQGPATYDDANSNWSYTGSWATYTGSGPYANTLHYTTDATATASFPFTGAGFVLSYTKFSNRGNIDVWVDGSKITTLNANNPSLTWQNTYSSPAYSGPHTVTLKHGGPAGAVIDIDAIQVRTTDLLPPGAVTNLSATTGTINGSVNVSWNAPADDVGNNASGAVAAYLVRYSTNPITTETNWTNASVVNTGLPVPATPGAAQSMTIMGLNPGTLYYVAVRAQDEQPNLGAFASSSATAKVVPAQGAGTYDDANSTWSYTGSWSTISTSGPYASTLHYTTQQNAMASFVFQAPAKFVLSYTTYSNRGNIEVWVDGSLLTTLNANSASLVWQKTYTSPNYADSGSHTVVLKNANTAGQVIDVDAIQIVPPPGPQGAGMYDDADASWSYSGSWSTLSTSGPYASTLHYTSDATATASFPFTGAGFVLSYTKFSNRGNIEVWVDGSLLTTLNANNPSLTWQNTYSSPSYTGPHTVTFKHGGPAGAIIDIDAIQVLP